ncbi:MAG: CidA/LrgA family protein [Cypionkella sp.]
MIHALLAIFACQLIGEAASHALALPLPGPVLGMILMLLALQFIPQVAVILRPVAQGILANLSLLFVPAGVGVVGHFAEFNGQALAMALAIIGSTVAAIAVGAISFVAVARLTGNADD